MLRRVSKLVRARGSRKILGQELKLIKHDQRHEELLEKYDFLVFSVRKNKEGLEDAKERHEAQKERREDANANQRTARGIVAHLPKNGNR